MRSKYIVFCKLPMLLFAIFGVTVVTFLFNGTLHVSAEHHGQKDVRS